MGICVGLVMYKNHCSIWSRRKGMQSRGTVYASYFDGFCVLKELKLRDIARWPRLV